MDYVPEDLVIVSCENGHEHQVHSVTEIEEVRQLGLAGNRIDYTPPEIIPPNITNITCTSPEPDDTTEPYTTIDTTPTFVLDTDENSDCSISDSNSSYTACTTTGATTHTCTLPNEHELHPGDDTIWFSCVDGSGNNNTAEYEMFIGQFNCQCPGDGNDWNILLSDACYINDDCDLGTGKMNFFGNFTINATINVSNVIYPSFIIMDSGGTLNIG